MFLSILYIYILYNTYVYINKVIRDSIISHSHRHSKMFIKL